MDSDETACQHKEPPSSEADIEHRSKRRKPSMEGRAHTFGIFPSESPEASKENAVQRVPAQYLRH